MSAVDQPMKACGLALYNHKASRHETSVILFYTHLGKNVCLPMPFIAYLEHIVLESPVNIHRLYRLAARFYAIYDLLMILILEKPQDTRHRMPHGTGRR